MIEIIPDLWIYKDSELNNIKNFNNIHIINTTQDLNFLGNFKNYKNEIKNKILKYEILKLYNYICKKVDTIYNNLLNNNLIIVTCKTGRQFSNLIILCFLIKYGKLSVKDSILYFKSKKNDDIYSDNLFFNNILYNFNKL